MKGEGRDPRRLGLGAAAIIAAYAGVVGLISAQASGSDLGPPSSVQRAVAISLLLMLPAALAAIGAARRSSPLLVTAGILCLAQAFIAFSGVTLPFIVPAVLLLALGVNGTGVHTSSRATVGAVLALGLGVGAWIATLGLTGTVCWVARTGPDGALVYTQVPDTDVMTLQLGDVAGGCDGGVTTTEGLALAVILAVGAIVVAELSSRRQVVGSGRNEESAAETATNSGEP